MQSPTHFLMGILIYRLFESFIGFSNNIIGIILKGIVFILIFFSHFLVDAIAKITYHVPDARPQDKFWLSYHIFIFGLTIFLAIWFIIPYFWVMLFSVLIDIIDWGILRGLMKKNPIIHPLIDKFRNKFFSWLPNLIEKKWTVINEFIILFILGLGIYLL
ncbi:MAG: hypothetical protein ACTSRZ_11060 [Promethearchaeota archaeon]